MVRREALSASFVRVGHDQDSARRVLLVGGSGLLSGTTRDAFLARGHEVTVVTRGERPLPWHPHLRTLVADRHHPGQLAEVLRGERFDFTVDFLAYDAADVEYLSPLGIPGFVPGRLVMISTGQVYLIKPSLQPPFRERDVSAPNMEMPEGDRDQGEWEYGMNKLAAEVTLERIARSLRIPFLALRFPVIQGERDGEGSRRLWAWLERMRDGGPVLLPDGGRQIVRFLYAGDVARALLELATTERWPEEPALNLAQPDETTLREFLDRVAAIAGLVPRFVPVAADVLREAGLADTCAPYWGRWCSRLDPSLALERLQLRTRSSADYLPDVVRAHLEEPPAHSHPGYSRRAEELALAARLA